MNRFTSAENNETATIIAIRKMRDKTSIVKIRPGRRFRAWGKLRWVSLVSASNDLIESGRVLILSIFNDSAGSGRVSILSTSSKPALSGRVSTLSISSVSTRSGRVSILSMSAGDDTTNVSADLSVNCVCGIGEEADQVLTLSADEAENSWKRPGRMLTREGDTERWGIERLERVERRETPSRD